MASLDAFQEGLRTQDAGVAQWVLQFVNPENADVIDEITEDAWATSTGRTLLNLFSDALIEFVHQASVH